MKRMASGLVLAEASCTLSKATSSSKRKVSMSKNRNKQVKGAEISASTNLIEEGNRLASANEGQSTMNEEQSTMNEEQSTTNEQQLEQVDAGAETQPEATGEAPSAEHDAADVKQVPQQVTTMGIGQFVRHLLLKSTKSNADILALVIKLFPEAKTTPACIAWYKSDLRKKGLLPAGTRTGNAVKIVQLSEEELQALLK
jgi:hypothetical protein